MDDLTVLKERLEYMFLRLLINLLRANALDVPTAKKDAAAFIHLEPFSSMEDAKQKVDTFVGDNPALQSLKEYVDAFHHEQNIDRTVEKMREHLKVNDIDKALEVAKA